ncbi:F-box/LRR-repeat protein 21-like [Littorina saxatilis]|uniref:F-box domain-containing protein n=1 Tax=Littorina saxatilis TaxID=31220 RepID=A0AAN9GES1_9CAEN
MASDNGKGTDVTNNDDTQKTLTVSTEEKNGTCTTASIDRLTDETDTKENVHLSSQKHEGDTARKSSSIDIHRDDVRKDSQIVSESQNDVSSNVSSSHDDGDDVRGCDDVEENDGGPDFSHLPDLVWVSVFQLLSLADRFRLSQVNWFFNTLFHDGAVWRQATISFTKALVHGYFYMARDKLTLPETDKKLARKFGHFYRDVTLRVRGRPEEMEDDTRQILSHLLQTWRLETLTLDIGDREWGNRYQGVESINETLLTSVVLVLREATSLRALHVLHWPHSYLINDDTHQLHQMLSAAECHKLKSLRLPRTSENSVSTLPAPGELAVSVVSKFRCLRHLHVTSDMLSDALFKALVKSRDVRLEQMSVEVNGFWSTGFLEHLLSPLPWSTLTACNPEFVVAMTISADVPEFAFAQFLVPEIPLVGITFDINCHCYRKAFQLMHQYCDTLRSFRCFSDPQDCELELLDMVRTCTHLQHLLYHGDISDYNVLKLAECGGRRWGEFSFLWRNIEKTQKRPTPFNLVSTITGHHNDDDLNRVQTEEEVKAEFCQQVSQRLGFPWEPLVL